MYIKKILLAIVLIGLVIAGLIANYVYSAMFKPNTNFDNQQVYIYIPTDSKYEDVREQLEPLLKNIDKFDALAVRKKYTSNVKPGKFVIEKGMNNNEIINSIRSNNIPVKVSFNNQETLPQLAGRIASQIEADSLSLLNALKDDEFLKENGFHRKYFIRNVHSKQL